MKKFSHWYISTKLLLLNVLIFLIIGGLIVVVFFSFSDIESMMTRMINDDVSQAIANGSIGRNLTTLIADTSHLIDRFLEQDNLLATEGTRLIESITALVTQSFDTRLEQALQEFIQQFQAFLEQGSMIVNMSQQLNITDQELNAWLEELESTIANTIISVKMNGLDTSGLERLNLELPWYREALLRVNISLYRIVQKHLRVALTDEEVGQGILEILVLLDELDARLQPLTGFESDVKGIGQPLIDGVRSYKESIATFYRELTTFQQHLMAINTTQRDVLAVLEEIDEQITQTTENMESHIRDVMFSSRQLVIGLSAGIFIVMALGWLGIRRMVHPLLQVSRIAEQLADGDIECDVHQLRRATSSDEIGILSRAFIKLITYIQEMATVAREISTGNLSRSPGSRSERDVLGYAFLEMSSYLNDMASVATAIATGDLRREITPKTEHDVLGNAFQKMTFLRDLISEIMTGSSQLLRSSEELSQVSTQMASFTEQTSQQAYVVSTSSKEISNNVDAVAASTEQLSSNIHEISEHTEKVSQIANKAAEIAISTATAMIDLETRSQEIGEIIHVITDVTQQTNLLALNATIEAARAGDAGRGFAVVAHEIKELSRETAASAEDIIQKLEAIKVNSSETTVAIAKVSDIVIQIRDLAHSTASGVEEQSVTTHTIARQMTQTAQENQDITRVITEVATSVHQTSKGVLSIQHAAEELASLAERLQGIIKGFKV